MHVEFTLIGQSGSTGKRCVTSAMSQIDDIRACPYYYVHATGSAVYLLYLGEVSSVACI